MLNNSIRMTKTVPQFYEDLLDKFPFSPTSKQKELLEALAAFTMHRKDASIFVLKGYAGTGKTTVISTVVNTMWKVGVKAVLLAPTGRAAKVISNYSNRQAFTIHKKIYHPKKTSNGGVQFVKQVNKHTNTIFFVDESSMISSSNATKLANEVSLLDDLVDYVYSGSNCKLVFIGDTAQLPPVKSELSPALDIDELRYRYDREVQSIELDEVMRQQEASGILNNATDLRYQINNNNGQGFKFELNYPDIIRLEDGYDIQDAIQEAYRDLGVEDTAFVVRSNKRANQYNQQIRTKIRGQENDISTGDYVMVVKNNYFWLKDSSDAGFIANGDTCEIMHIKRIKELYGFRFAEVRLRMIDYKDQKPFETVLLLDTLTSETPSLSYEESNRLYQEIAKDYADEKSNYKRLLAIKGNPYFNALQVKFGYAMTCHKSQGGQWETVFIEQPYLPEGESVSYYRWLYTAMTRAREKLYLIGFKNDSFLD